MEHRPGLMQAVSVVHPRTARLISELGKWSETIVLCVDVSSERVESQAYSNSARAIDC